MTSIGKHRYLHLSVNKDTKSIKPNEESPHYIPLCQSSVGCPGSDEVWRPLKVVDISAVTQQQLANEDWGQKISWMKNLLADCSVLWHGHSLQWPPIRRRLHLVSLLVYNTQECCSPAAPTRTRTLSTPESVETKTTQRLQTHIYSVHTAHIHRSNVCCTWIDWTFLLDLKSFVPEFLYMMYFKSFSQEVLYIYICLVFKPCRPPDCTYCTLNLPR